MQILHRTWAEISVSRLRENWAAIRGAVPSDVEIVATLKADAYGHGAEACGAALRGAGATWFGVSSSAEGRRLRAVCPDGGILILSHHGGDCREVLDHRLIAQIGEARQVDALEAAWRDRGRAGRVPVHIEVDTGMARGGVRSAGALEALLSHCRTKTFLDVEGVMTHFSSPEALQPAVALRQIEALRRLLAPAVARGASIKRVHAGSSPTAFVPRHLGALRRLGGRLGAVPMIRPGTSLFGHAPRFSPPGTIDPPALKPVLSWKTRVASLTRVPRGATAGYDMTFRALRPTRLAVIPVGYADGLSRLLSNKGVALVGGRRAPYAGRVSMDLTLLDVTDHPGVSVGDEVVLIGEQGGEAVSAYDMADAIGTIPDEVTCAVGAHVPRSIVP